MQVWGNNRSAICAVRATLMRSTNLRLCLEGFGSLSWSRFRMIYASCCKLASNAGYWYSTAWLHAHIRVSAPVGGIWPLECHTCITLHMYITVISTHINTHTHSLLYVLLHLEVVFLECTATIVSHVSHVSNCLTSLTWHKNTSLLCSHLFFDSLDHSDVRPVAHSPVPPLHLH